MENLALSQFLSLFTWFTIATLLFFVLLISRFYQKFSGERTRYPWIGVVIIMFGIATVRYASLRRVSGDVIADLLSFFAGIFLMVLSMQLYLKMTQKKK